MPHRLSRLAEAVHNRRVALRRTRHGVNDNAAYDDGGLLAGFPEPRWRGPGTIVSLGTQDGRHRMGAVRAAAQATTGDPAADVAVLLRLLEHYGAWMGFEGRVEPVRPGEMRRLPVPVESRPACGSVEYRLDLLQIARKTQTLTADGTILLDGRPAAALDGVSITFRPTQAATRYAERPARLDA